MWTRVELKERAKAVLKNCYWSMVIVAFIFNFVTGGFSNDSDSGVNFEYKESYNEIQTGGSDIMSSGSEIIKENISNLLGSSRNLISRIIGTGLGILILGAGAVVMLLGIAFGILVGNPVQVGTRRFFMCSREQKTDIGEILYSFRQKEFWNIVLIMLVSNVKVFLWGLLFVIPGIVKSYEYRMLPYILAENPGIRMEDAFAISREMTMGHKMEIFILDLSFIPWNILSGITLGIAGVFWVSPYMMATLAELYAVRREDVLMKGIVPSGQLPGFYIA